ncbi:hypothetical protein HELRODRAFT_182175 [Helobdella robusta]|uniref:Uncharacterized protein n=1 Tax=Helobdella robusta TaxID=6412 RepID=T1FHV5_HELRO|nr:hypothetical protein HELRODRAFT_182175 [Helobdella robusta]ESN91203.1 hypothetical protein HELRODRAFT_182175 [Helobdella robusta]
MNLLQISSLIFICAILARYSASGKASDAEIEELKKLLPETLTLTLPVSADKKITLNLKKSQKDAAGDDILIIVSDHDSENIWKPRNKEYGTFTHGKEAFVLRPESESPNVKDVYKVVLDGVPHCIFHHLDAVNFGSGDEIKTKRSANIEMPVLRKRNSGIARSKRPASTEIVIDVLAVCDYSIFQSWMKFNNNDKQKAILNIKYYFANVINSVSKKYESIKRSKYGYKYSAKLISLFIASTPQDSSFTENSGVKVGDMTMNINKALDEFTKWIQEKDQQGKIPKFDVATAFTK